jgi:hypothetical protein
MGDKQGYTQQYDAATGETKWYYTDNMGITCEVRDVEAHKRAHEATSHREFFRNNKQAVKRYNNVVQQVERMMYDQAQVNYAPDVKQVSDSTYLNDLRHDPKFQPLNTYRHKLTTKSGKQVRPIFAGEVGMIGSQIYVLQPGYGRLFVGGLDTKKEGT